MGPWNPTFRRERETWGTPFRGVGREKRPTRHDNSRFFLYGGESEEVEMTPPRPVIARFLESPSGELLYAVVEQMRDDDVQGEMMRFRVHYHPAGAPRTATTSNTVLLDETGNQCDLRLLFVKFLLEKRDAGWKRSGASTFGSSPTEQFWSLENL